ncbi:Uncharacterized protein HZ326_27352, partial [Fusarium oxysporum f. sp. albedinis]
DFDKAQIRLGQFLPIPSPLNPPAPFSQTAYTTFLHGLLSGSFNLSPFHVASTLVILSSVTTTVWSRLRRMI